jgi:hypothetical protein
VHIAVSFLIYWYDYYTRIRYSGTTKISDCFYFICMNNFNKVFTTVQRSCTEKGAIEGGNQFQKLAMEVGLPLDRLHFYLDCLNEVGVINYTSRKKAISLTEKGTKVERIFPA